MSLFLPLVTTVTPLYQGKADILKRLTTLFRDAPRHRAEQNPARKGLSPAAHPLRIFCNGLHFCTGPPSIALGPSVERGTEKPIGMRNTVPTSAKRKSLANHSYCSGARLPDLPVHGSLRPVCHGSVPSSQRSLLLPEHWSPCLLPTASPSPHQLNCHSWLAWRQVRTGRNLEEGGIRGRGGLSAPAALLLPVKLV